MKKNVLLIISQLHGGGAEKAIADLSTYLSEEFNVILVIFNNTHLPTNPHKGELLKIELPYSKNTDQNPFHKRLIRFIHLIKQLRKIKKERRIDVSISFLEASNFVNVLSGGREKLILSVRSHLSNEFNDNRRLRIFKPMIRFLYKKADHIVVPASLLKIDLHKKFGVPEQKISVIYNFIDKDYINDKKTASIPDHHEMIFKKPVLINVGRFSNPKAQWLLISLLKKAKAAFPSIQLVLLGEGNLKTKLLETAAQENLKIYQEGVSPSTALETYDVFLLGHLRNPYPYLNRSTLFIMSSIYEGFPNVIIEAMACSLPVVSSDCLSGPREILSPASNQMDSAKTVEFAEYGILTPSFNRINENSELYLNEAVKGISYILGSEENMRRYKTKSLKRVNDFQRQNIIPKWIELIR